QQFLSIQQYVGSYIGHYLSVQKRGLICECILEIHPDGFAKLFRYGDPTGLEGIVYVENNELFVLTNMNPNTTRYRSALTLKHRVECENQLFSGNFSNMQDEYMPNAGRIIFQRIESDRIPKQEKYHVNTPADLDLFQEIHGDYAWQVIDFLRGFGGDAYSDDPFQVFKNSPFDLAGSPGNKPPVVNTQASSPMPSVSVRPDWNGLYEAYIVQTFNRQGEQTPHMLQRLSVNINTQYAVFRSKRNEFHARYLPANPHFLLAELKMDGALIPEIFVCLHPDQLSEQPNSRFVGTYSGIGQTGIQHPNAGRVLLLRSDRVVEPDDFPLDLSNERLQKLMNDRPGIMDFFLGLDDYMVEGYRLFREERVLPVSMPGSRKVARDMSGVYLRYRLDSDGKSIDVQPVSIMPDGQVRMLSMFGNYQYAGMLNEMPGDIIAISFHAIQYPDGKYEDFYAQSLLYKHKLKEQAKYYKGLHLSRILDNPGKSFTCRTVMVRIAESTTDLASYINQVKAIAIPVFGEHKDLAEFNQINAEHHNILLNLMGEDDNLMTNFAEGASGLKLSFNKSVDFGLHYFLAAAYYAESADPNKFNKAKTAWKQAIKHGFRDKVLLQEYKNSGRLPGFEHLFTEGDMLP
ncbi:MAG: hypothetical protein IT269_03495, partial [Saprospiraceae bacterium]|nr:hypothetical protein [Saprospiraceae bacterium]